MQFPRILADLNPFKPRPSAQKGKPKQPDGGIMRQTYAVQVKRLRQDVGKWRDALDRAESVYFPDRTDLLNIYADLVLDLHLASVIETRKINVLRQKFKLQNAAGEVNWEATKLIRKAWFRQFCSLALEKITYGHSLIEFTPGARKNEWAKVELIPRQYVSPELGIVRTMPGMIVGTDFRQDPAYAPWLLEVGEATDLGLLNKAAMFTICKKNVVGAWADFTELFGMPFRSVSTAAEGDELDQIEDALANMGQAAYGVFPEDTEVKFIQAATANERLYDLFLERTNSELSKLVLGQTMTTDSGSSRSQGEVHERVADAYTEADSEFLLTLINDTLLPFLIGHGWPLGELEFVWDETVSLPLTEQIKIVQSLMQFSGRKVSRAYLEETFGVEFDDDPPPALPPVSTPAPVLPGKPEHSPAPGQPGSATAQLTALYGGCSCAGPAVAAVTAAAPAPLLTLWERVVRVLYANGSAALDALPLEALPLYEYVNQELQGAIDVAWNAPDPALRQLLSQNVQRFSGFKTYEVCQQLTGKLFDAQGLLRGFEEFQAEAQLLNQLYNVQYLRTEYEQAVAGAQMASKWAGFAGDGLLQYRTVGDELVRPEHRLYDQITLPKSHPWWAEHYPPNDWNCRCDTVEVFDEPETAPDQLPALPAVPKLFQHNVGATGQLFGEQHPYFQQPAPVKKALEKQLKLAL